MDDLPRKVITREDWKKMLKDVQISKKEMNKLVMNFLVIEGYDVAARAFIKESGTRPDLNLATLSTRADVKQKILNGKVEDAFKTLVNSYQEVLNTNSLLHFHLQQQRLIEIIRGKKLKEALDFAKEHITPLVERNPEFREEMERTISLLAFEDPYNCPVGELLGTPHLVKTANEVNVAILTSEHEEKDPKLTNVLKTLIWVQDQLHKKAAFPRMDVSSGVLKDPVI